MDDTMDNGKNNDALNADEEDDDVITTVFVGNIDKDITESILYKVFIDMGPITDVRIVPPKPGNNRTYGFVDYKYRCGALYALACMNNVCLNGQKINLKVDGSSHLREWALPEGYPVHLYPALAGFKANRTRLAALANSSSANNASINSMSIYGGHNNNNVNNSYDSNSYDNHYNRFNRNGYGYGNGIRFQNYNSQNNYRSDQYRANNNNYSYGRDHGAWRNRSNTGERDWERERERDRDRGRDRECDRDRDHGARRKRKYSSDSDDNQPTSTSRYYAKRRRSRSNSNNRSRSRSRGRNDKQQSASRKHESKNPNQYSRFNGLQKL